MSDQPDRPDVWVGHVVYRTPLLQETEELMKQLGLRPVFRSDSVAILELRGGTHIAVIEDREATPGDAGFDFMVEDLEKSHEGYSQLGLDVSDIEQGDIHAFFYVNAPCGSRIQFNSTHVEDHGLV